MSPMRSWRLAARSCWAPAWSAATVSWASRTVSSAKLACDTVKAVPMIWSRWRSYIFFCFMRRSACWRVDSSVAPRAVFMRSRSTRSCMSMFMIFVSSCSTRPSIRFDSSSKLTASFLAGAAPNILFILLRSFTKNRRKKEK